MELDVHINRKGDEPWGFRLTGGADLDMPLTVIKVMPMSPADTAGLQNGDAIIAVNGFTAENMSQEEAGAVFDDTNSLTLGVVRGLYDPILDDHEPIFEPIEPQDFDQPSQATEVQFLLHDFPETPLLSESRSLTASPFVLPTKPYRPFSTEPLPDIPPLEDPIILNDKYQDDFTKYGITEDLLPKTRFKLPVSEHYDPDGTKLKEVKQEKDIEQVSREVEIQYLEQMREEIDLEGIELTATSVVDDSIERAISVTEDIRKEIAIELHEIELNASDDNISKTEGLKVSKVFNESKQKTDEFVEQTDIKTKETDKILYESNTQIENKIEKHESVRVKRKSIEEKNILDTKDQLESIVQTSADEKKELKVSNFECVEQNKLKDKETKIISENIQSKQLNGENYENSNKTHLTTKVSETKQATKNITDSQMTNKFSTTKLLADQKAYLIGLQTIPNIRGSVHSSYKYDLLLKTFFIHLTDVMVALSRFILSEPTLPLSSDKAAENLVLNKSQEVNDETINKSNKTQKCVNIMNENLSEERYVQKDLMKDKSYVSTEDTLEVRQKEKLSGSKMAQLSQKKTEELTHKMDAVISEFQNKTLTDDVVVLKEDSDIQRNRRSRSRSYIEEVISKESDPLEWLSKMDDKNNSNQRTITNELPSNTSELLDVAVNELRHESTDTKIKESKATKNMYVAIVEAHVYTNKDAILEEQLSDLSETVSLQSVDEINFATKTLDTLSLQTVAIGTEHSKTESHQEFENDLAKQTSKNDSSFDLTTRQIEYQKDFVELNTKQALLTNEIDLQVKAVNTNVEAEEHSESLVDIKNCKTLCMTDVSKVNTNIKEKAHEVKVEESIRQFDKLVSQEKEVDESCSKAENHTEEIVQSTIRINDLKENIIEECDSTVDHNSITKINEVTQEHISEFTDESIGKAKTNVTVEDIAIVEVANNQICKSIVDDQSISNVTHFEQITQKVETKKNDFESESFESILESNLSENKYQSQTLSQGATFVAKSLNLSLRTDLDPNQKPVNQTSVHSDENNNVDTPSPSTVPPTPLTDEYIFRLEIPLPKNITPMPREPSPEEIQLDEDPHIVKKKLIPHIETTIETVIYDPPLPTPPEENTPNSPIFTKPGLRGGSDKAEISKDEILEIERRSSLLASAIDETIKSIEEYKESVGIENVKSFNSESANSTVSNITNLKEQNLESSPIFYNGFSKVTNKVYEDTEDLLKQEMEHEWNEIKKQIDNNNKKEEEHQKNVYITESGEILGTTQGIVDGLEDVVLDEEVAKQLGKPGMTEDKIAELISGESEMLREAHVMGLSRVLSSHMNRSSDDDSSVDFKKIKPIIESLNESEVLKALNDEITKTKEEKKKEERKWTTFLQKPKRPVPKIKHGYYQNVSQEEDIEEPYKVKIVKQPKPKVAPDYKPEDFDTGPLPWEERAHREPSPPPVEPEDPILVPEEKPDFFEAVDPLPESEVPDLEETGIILPTEGVKDEESSTEIVVEEKENKEENKNEEEVLDLEAPPAEETQATVLNMEQNKLAEQLVMSVQSMVDPTASIEQQLAQMRAQLAALAQLPGVIQQTLELVTQQLSQINHQDPAQVVSESQTTEFLEEKEVAQNNTETIHEEESAAENQQSTIETTEEVKSEDTDDQKLPNGLKSSLTHEELELMKKEEAEMLEEQRKIEKQKKELMAQMQQELESRQLKQRSTPRVGKPKPMFGPLTPQERPLVLPGGRKWRKPKDAYNDQFIAETLTAQAEIIQGKAKGLPYESVRLPYDERINFMKYEKPPVSLDHLQHSDVYKLIHNMEQGPMKRIEMLTPVMAEADYREKCRSLSPNIDRMAMEEHLDIPQQVQP